MDAFKEYDLGAHQERLRNISFGNSPIPWYEYPIIIEQVRLGTIESSEMMVLHKKGKYKHKKLYSITLAGLNFDFYIDDNYIDKEHELIFMKPIDMPITSIQMDELNVGQQFLKRFTDEDVKNFYKKHK